MDAVQPIGSPRLMREVEKEKISELEYIDLRLAVMDANAEKIHPLMTNRIISLEKKGDLLDSALSQECDTAREALLAYIDPAAVDDNEGKTILHYAREYGWAEVTELLLFLEGTPLNARDRRGKPPWNLACEAEGEGHRVGLRDSGASDRAWSHMQATPDLMMLSELR